MKTYTINTKDLLNALANIPRSKKNKLMTKTIEKRIPGLYKTENIPMSQKKAYVKYFDLRSDWKWYGVEYDPEQKLFFGFVKGFEGEWGYFSLQELEENKTIERDKRFTVKKCSEIKDIICCD